MNAPSLNIVRPLGYWEAITAINARRALGAGNMVITASGRGPMDETVFRTACRHLFDRHEILKSRFSEGDPLPSFIRDVKFEDLLLTEQHAETETDEIAIWEQMLHEELPDRRRLWEGRFAPSHDGNTWRVFFKLHHAIADGRSMGAMLNQFLRAAGAILDGDALPTEELPIALPAEQRVHPRVDRDEWLQLLSEQEEEPPITPWPLEHEADIDRRRPRISPQSLTAEETETLHQRAHEEGTTVLGAFVSALARVHARAFQGMADSDMVVPMDMRRVFAEDPHPDEILMCAYCARILMDGVQEQDSPWELARTFRTRLEPMMGHTLVPPWNFQPDDAITSFETWLDFEGHYRHGFCPTNVGVLPYTGDSGPLITDRVDMTAAVHFGGIALLIPMVTHKGILRANFTWTEPLMNEDTAKDWVDQVWTEIRSMAQKS